MLGTRSGIVFCCVSVGSSLRAVVSSPKNIIIRWFIIIFITIVIGFINFLNNTRLVGVYVFVFGGSFIAPVVWVGHSSIVNFVNIAEATPAIRGVGRGGQTLR